MLTQFFFLPSARANNTPQVPQPPFSQDWSNAGLITANDNWSGVPGIEGFLGQDITTSTGTDPQTLLGTSAAANDLDVIANQSNTAITNGGVAEFDGIANRTVALQGSGTADAPHIVINLNTTGFKDVVVSYNLRDIDASADNAIQPVALQYRVGTSDNFTNFPAAFVADATTGPSLATLVTPVSALLPSAVNNKPHVQVRVMTTNAVGNDEWVGVDDIVVSADVAPPGSTDPTGAGSASPNTVAPGGSTTLTVNVTPGTNPPSTGLSVTADLSSINIPGAQPFTDQGGNVFTLAVSVPPSATDGVKTIPVTISDAENRSSTTNISLTIETPPPPSDHVVISQIYGGGGNASATYRNDYVELFNPSPDTFSLNGWSVQYASSAGTTWQVQLLAGAIAPGEYYLVRLGSNGAVGLELPPANVEGTVNMAAGAGKVALVRASGALTGGCPIGDSNLVDFVGYGAAATCREGLANAPGPGNNATATLRKSNGAQDTNQNGSDFALGAPNPRRTAPIIDAPPAVLNIDLDSEPFASTPGAPRDGSVSVFFSEAVEVTGAWYDLNCAGTGAHATVVANGPQHWIITPDENFQPGEVCTFKIFASQVRDSDTDDSVPNTDLMQADFEDTFTVATGNPPPFGPETHLAFGNPSGAVANVLVPNNFLMEKPEFALSYNRDRGTPNWVSWHLSSEWIGNLQRVDTFRPDPAVPVEWYRVLQTDYSGSGFDRGHMVPNADRDEGSSLPVNQATFLMTNIVPQSPDNNQGPWADMENDLRALTPANELYVVAGGAGTGGAGSAGSATTIAGGRVTVPAQTWKVALVLPDDDQGDDLSRVTCGTRTIAVVMPNVQGIRNDDWQNYLTTVDAVEALTGYDFFANLPDAVEHCVEAGVNGANPPGAAGQSVTTDEDVAAAITLDAASPGGALDYIIVSGPANGTLSGSGAGRTYTPNPNFHGADSFTFKVNDGTNDSNTATVQISVTPVNDAPTLAPIADKTVYLGETLTFTAAGSDVDGGDETLTYVLIGTPPAGAAIDPATGVFSWTPTAAQAGQTHSITVRVTDEGQLFADQTFGVGVAHNWSGVLQPINADGSSVFRVGRVVPVRFQLTGASAGVTDAVIRLYVAKVSDTVAGTEVEAETNSSATEGNIFRFADGQYLFNLDTRGLTAGTYQLRIDMGDDVERIVQFSLR